MKSKKIIFALLTVVILIGGIAIIRNLDKFISLNKGESHSTTEEV